MTNGSDEEWRTRAQVLQDAGVPSRRAEVVALREQGCTYDEIAAELGLAGRGNVYQHLDAYEESHADASALVEAGPDPDDL